MNIYLDIDGVILANDKHVANYAHEFIEHLVNKYPVYWLTTHCRGDASYTVNHLKMFFNSETMKLIERILPTNWDILKTDAIDFSQPFLWFDDDLFSEEKEILKQHNCLDSWMGIDLANDENQLKKYLEI